MIGSGYFHGVIDCTLSQNWNDGIYAEDSCMIERNTIGGNNNGITVISRCVIRDNLVTTNGKYGISLGEYGLFDGNLCYMNSRNNPSYRDVIGGAGSTEGTNAYPE